MVISSVAKEKAGKILCFLALPIGPHTVNPGKTMEISKTTIGIAAGVAGTLFLGYCIYFDHKRRKDPDFKKKLRESEYSGRTIACVCAR